MQIIAVQLDTVWLEKAASQARVRALLADATIESDAMIVLPETFDTGFGGKVELVADDKRGESARFLADLAKEHACYVMGGVVHRAEDGRGLNVALVFDPAGAEIARYTKLHPFTYSGEAKYFQAGQDIIHFDWRGATVTPFVCYDLRFPEVFRLAARRGGEVMPVIANWPAQRINHWVTLLRARAIENQAYVIGVNRCGSDPNLRYTGRSMIVDPRGEVLADAGEGEAVVSAKLDLESLRAYRREFPVLADMRERFIGGGAERAS